MRSDVRGAGKPRDVAAWLNDAVADAERRGLPELKPLLEGLALATTLLRSADWNEDASLPVDTPGRLAEGRLAEEGKR